MASIRLIHWAIVTCLLSATVVLGGCSPPLPKTWLPPPDSAISIEQGECASWRARVASGK